MKCTISMKKICAGCFLAVLLSLLWCGNCFAQEFVITDAELTRLESNLNQLEIINSRSLLRLNSLEKKLEASEMKLVILRQTSEQQEKLLQIANESLLRYEQENKKKIRRLEMQRTIWTVLAVGALACAVERSL